MSKPMDMSKDNRKELSDTLISNVQKLKMEHNIKTDAELMRQIREKTDCDFNQSKISDILNGKTFPTMLELIAIADFFDVTIDFLLGRETKKNNLTVSETCEFLIRMQESGLQMRYGTITVEETELDGMSGYHRTRDITYNTIYFSEENCPPLPFDTLPCDDNIHSYKKGHLINKFIQKLLRLNLTKHDIGKEIYNEIISQWIKQLKYFDNDTTFEDDMYYWKF